MRGKIFVPETTIPTLTNLEFTTSTKMSPSQTSFDRAIRKGLNGSLSPPYRLTDPLQADFMHVPAAIFPERSDDVRCEHPECMPGQCLSQN